MQVRAPITCNNVMAKDSESQNKTMKDGLIYALTLRYTGFLFNADLTKSTDLVF